MMGGEGQRTEAPLTAPPVRTRKRAEGRGQRVQPRTGRGCRAAGGRRAKGEGRRAEGGAAVEWGGACLVSLSHVSIRLADSSHVVLAAGRWGLHHRWLLLINSSVPRYYAVFYSSSCNGGALQLHRGWGCPLSTSQYLPHRSSIFRYYILVLVLAGPLALGAWRHLARSRWAWACCCGERGRRPSRQTSALAALPEAVDHHVARCAGARGKL